METCIWRLETERFETETISYGDQYMETSIWRLLVYGDLYMKTTCIWKLETENTSYGDQYMETCI